MALLPGLSMASGSMGFSAYKHKNTKCLVAAMEVPFWICLQGTLSQGAQLLTPSSSHAFRSVMVSTPGHTSSSCSWPMTRHGRAIGTGSFLPLEIPLVAALTSHQSGQDSEHCSEVWGSSHPTLSPFPAQVLDLHCVKDSLPSPAPSSHLS